MINLYEKINAILEKILGYDLIRLYFFFSSCDKSVQEDKQRILEIQMI